MWYILELLRSCFKKTEKDNTDCGEVDIEVEVKNTFTCCVTHNAE